jgi:carotenoid cleavage dioxygenase
LRISAHPKVDEATGEQLFFEYGTDPPYMTYGVVGPDGDLRHHVPIALPGPRLPHDMAITERYAILQDLPLYHDSDALAIGRHKIAFHPEIPARFGVIPRRGAPDELCWFEAAPCFLYHVVNAWEEGDEVVMVGCRYVPPTDASGRIDAEGMARMIARLEVDARLYRWRFDLRSGRTHEEAIDAGRNVEFPTTSTALTGRRTRWAYTMVQTRERPLFRGIVRHDLETGAAEEHSDGPGAFYSEAPFAPRDGGIAEDDGYLVSFVWNGAAGRSELHVLDAREVARGPIARVVLPQRVPLGFHATWIPASRLAGKEQG